MKGADGNLHAAFTTQYLLLNATRALNCRFDVGFHVDGAHRLCDADMCLCLMEFNELGNTFRLLLATTSSSESTEEFRDAF